jgi:hypothetical protein
MGVWCSNNADLLKFVSHSWTSPVFSGDRAPAAIHIVRVPSSAPIEGNAVNDLDFIGFPSSSGIFDSSVPRSQLVFLRNRDLRCGLANEASIRRAQAAPPSLRPRSLAELPFARACRSCRAHNRSLPSGTRRPSMPNQQVFDDGVDARMLCASEFRVFVEGKVARAANLFQQAEHPDRLTS